MATTMTTVFFCTYRNKDTKNAWRRSREYPSMQALLSAMQQYLTKWPTTQVTFQTRTYYSLEQP